MFYDDDTLLYLEVKAYWPIRLSLEYTLSGQSFYRASDIQLSSWTTGYNGLRLWLG
jgi:hypothetical protein